MEGDNRDDDLCDTKVVKDHSIFLSAGKIGQAGQGGQAGQARQAGQAGQVGQVKKDARTAKM